ncbi:MAG: hypothetical protein ABIP94_15465 [Planctomycetota bacterium]
MRPIAVLLLLLALPGLLLPAGFVLRVCRCTRAPVATLGAGEAQAAGCCTNIDAANHRGSHTTGACCQHSCCDSSSRDLDDAGQTCRAVCGCVRLVAPTDQPQPTPPEKTSTLRPKVPLVIAAVTIPPLVDLDYEHRWRAADNRPPPPDRQRNLPLLL